MTPIGIPFDGRIPLEAVAAVLREHLGESPGKGWLRITIERTPIGRGPGTQLHKLLGLMGMRPKPNCPCLEHVAEMDRREAAAPGWCAANAATIVGWLRAEAAARKLPFVDATGHALLRLAIRNARRAKKPADTHTRPEDRHQ